MHQYSWMKAFLPGAIVDLMAAREAMGAQRYILLHSFNGGEKLQFTNFDGIVIMLFFVSYTACHAT
ncbi:MAG: hypothetical protein WD625_10070, partial [Balneolales bacterium]